MCARGHLKNQPFGPGRLDRKKIWINSYLVNYGPGTTIIRRRNISSSPEPTPFKGSGPKQIFNQRVQRLLSGVRIPLALSPTQSSLAFPSL